MDRAGAPSDCDMLRLVPTAQLKHSAVSQMAADVDTRDAAARKLKEAMRERQARKEALRAKQEAKLMVCPFC